MFSTAKVIEDPVDDVVVLNRGNDSDSTPAAIARTIGRFINSRPEWFSVGILRQCIPRGMVGAVCCLLQPRTPVRTGVGGS